MKTSPSPLAALGHIDRHNAAVHHGAAIAASESARVAARDEQVAAVAAARRVGISWAEVGLALGVTRQAAWERFAGSVELLEYDAAVASS